MVRRNGEAPRHWHGTATHAAQRAAAVTFSRSSRWRSPASQECRVVAAALLQVAVTPAFRLAARPMFAATIASVMPAAYSPSREFTTRSTSYSPSREFTSRPFGQHVV